MTDTTSQNKNTGVFDSKVVNTATTELITNEALLKEFQTVKDTQQLMLTHIQNNRSLNKELIKTVLENIKQVAILLLLCGTTFSVYNNLDSTIKNKLGESYITQIIPVIVAVVAARNVAQTTKKTQKETDDKESDK